MRLRKFIPPMSIVLFLVLTLAGCTGTGQVGALPANEFLLSKTVPDKEWPVGKRESILQSEDMSFVWQEGNGLQGWDSLQLNHEGKGTYVWRSAVSSYKGHPEEWKRAQISVPAGKMAELRSLLAQSGFFSLNREYRTYAHDGTNVLVRVRGRGEAKEVYCGNYFPSAIRYLAGFVSEITADGSGNLEAKETISFAEARRIANALQPN